MFPNGWPGRALLLLRFVAGILLIHDGVRALLGAPEWEGIIRQSIIVAAGTLLLLGLWTPMAGVLVVIVELWIAFSTEGTLRDCVVLASLGAALAMLGADPSMPGSLDESALTSATVRGAQIPLDSGATRHPDQAVKEVP